MSRVRQKRKGRCVTEGREMVSMVLADEARLLTGVTGLGVECSSVVLRHCDSCLYVVEWNANAADGIS